jgi:glycosyltransferase involved in cell wall biosynthesis
MFNGITTLMPVFVRHLSKTTIADLLRAAESVLSQECRIPHELLIIDDGSNPRLESIPELRTLFSRPDVRPLQLIRNQGLEFALNAGIIQSRYDLIARMDGDDYWRPGKLAKQLEVLAADPALTLVATSMRLVHPQNPELDYDDFRGGGWNEVLALFKRVGCPFPHASILARKEVFRLLGGYPHDPLLTFFGDFALWGAWIRFFKVSILQEVLFEYTISEGQVSSQFQERLRRASGMVHQTFLNLGEHQKIPRAVVKIAEYLDLPLLKTSAVLCTAWRFYSHILVDGELYEEARIIFPDRLVSVYEDVGDLLADRFFYLHKGPYDLRPSRHARRVHTVESLEPLIPIVLSKPRRPN